MLGYGLADVVDARLRLGGAALITCIAMFLEATGRVAPFPEWKRQVPRAWVAWRPERAAAGFGFLLGGAVWTYLHHATFYAVGVLLVLIGDPLVGFAIGVAYGATRGLVLVGFWARARNTASPYALRLAEKPLLVRGLLCLVSFAALVASIPTTT